MDGIPITAAKSLYSLDAAVSGWYVFLSLKKNFLVCFFDFFKYKNSSESESCTNDNRRYYNRAIQGGLLMIKTGEGDARTRVSFLHCIFPG